MSSYPSILGRCDEWRESPKRATKVRLDVAFDYQRVAFTHNDEDPDSTFTTVASASLSREWKRVPFDPFLYLRILAGKAPANLPDDTFWLVSKCCCSHCRSIPLWIYKQDDIHGPTYLQPFDLEAPIHRADATVVDGEDPTEPTTRDDEKIIVSGTLALLDVGSSCRGEPSRKGVRGFLEAYPFEDSYVIITDPGADWTYGDSAGYSSSGTGYAGSIHLALGENEHGIPSLSCDEAWGVSAAIDYTDSRHIGDTQTTTTARLTASLQVS